MRRRWAWLHLGLASCAITAAASLWISAAFAEQRFTSIEPASDRLEAISIVQSALEEGYRPSCTIIATGFRVRFQCSGVSPARGGGDGEFVYRDFSEVGVTSSPPLLNLYAGHRARAPAHQLLIMHLNATQRRNFANAWLALANTPAAEAPEAFAGALQSSAPSNAEALRRVQLQVEAALRGNRNIDAARLYRDALHTAPGWADGHYNLGLLYGDLELYPEAITEMRRYLHLTPNAQDARAVQDQIYQWEALLPEAPQ